MSNKYFKPSVAYWWNEPITFAISLSNRTKEFGKTKVLGSRVNTKNKFEYVWADPVKAGLPNHMHLKNISYGYVPSGESSTSIRWLDHDGIIPVDNIKYITFNGVRIRKSEYDELYDPHTKQYPQTLINLKSNSNLQVSLPQLVERLKRMGEWNYIGNKRFTSTSIRRFDLCEWIGNFQRGHATHKLQTLRAWGHSMKIPKKAKALSMHRATYHDRFNSFACLFTEGQHPSVKAYDMVV